MEILTLLSELVVLTQIFISAHFNAGLGKKIAAYPHKQRHMKSINRSIYIINLWILQHTGLLNYMPPQYTENSHIFHYIHIAIAFCSALLCSALLCEIIWVIFDLSTPF